MPVRPSVGFREAIWDKLQRISLDSVSFFFLLFAECRRRMSRDFPEHAREGGGAVKTHGQTGFHYRISLFQQKPGLVYPDFYEVVVGGPSINRLEQPDEMKL